MYCFCLSVDNIDNFQVFYRNSSIDEPHLLTVPGCPALCPLNQFVKIVQPILPEHWETECQLTVLEAALDMAGVGIFVYIAASTLLLLVLAITFQLCRKRNLSSKDFVYQSLSVEAT